MTNIKSEIIGLSLTTILALSFNGCGGSSSSDDKNDTESTVSISGLVVDGYLKDAKVCLDKNLNRTCDSDETSTFTDKSGKYTLKISESDKTKYPIIAEIIANKTVDKDSGNTVDKSFILTTPIDKHQVISPITTLIKGQLDNNSSLNLTQATDLVSQKLNLTSDNLQLFKDYVKNEDSDSTSKKLHEVGKVITRLIVDIETKIKTDLGITSITTDQKKGLAYLINDIVIDNIDTIALKIKNENKISDELISEIDTIVEDNSRTQADLDEAIAKTEKTIVGSWYMGDASQSNDIVAFTFFDNGYYIMLQDGDIQADNSGKDGLERGTYSIDDNGLMTIHTITDTNGEWGLSHSSSINVSVNNVTLTFTEGVETHTFKRMP